MNPSHQVVGATELCTVAPNICGWSVLNKLHVTILSPRRLRWALDFVENLCTFALPCSQVHATCPYVEPNQSSPSLHLIPRRSTLILSSHLHPLPPPQVFQAFSSPQVPLPKLRRPLGRTGRAKKLYYIILYYIILYYIILYYIILYYIILYYIILYYIILYYIILYYIPSVRNQNRNKNVHVLFHCILQTMYRV